jgi:hypothetical protein
MANIIKFYGKKGFEERFIGEIRIETKKGSYFVRSENLLQAKLIFLCGFYNIMKS